MRRSCLLLLALTGCATSFPPYVPADCTETTALFAARDVLVEPDHDCFAWLDETHGRVARSGTASAAIWTRRTQSQTAVMASAVHTLAAGVLAPANTDIAEALRDPSGEVGTARIRLVAEDGIDSEVRTSPMFLLYNPAVPAEANANGFRDVLPVHDFYLAIVDGQQLEDHPILGLPAPLTDTPPTLYDPAMATATEPTFAAAVPGELVLVLGYAAGVHQSQPAMCASVGRVLDDGEALEAIAALATAGDEEGGIAYDAEVEMIIEGAAAGGMSGGGIFDRDGRLIGVLVRASEAPDLPQYIRAVRMVYIVKQLHDVFDALPAEQQAAVERYLEPLEEAVNR